MAQDVKLPKGIKRVTVIQVAPSGAVQPVVVYRPEAREKKQSRQLRMLERWARRSAKASRAFGEIYALRHRRSNRKRRDGWLRDLASNVLKASAEANKK